MAPVDLLTWPDLRDAEERAAAAEEALRTAQRQFWLAPHGKRKKRLSALETASQNALRAEVTLARLRREAGA